MRRVSIDEVAKAGLEHDLGLHVGPEYPDEAEAPRTDLETIQGLIQALLPSANTPGPRRFEAGYRRWLVLVWMITPEALGCETVADLAEELGVSVWAIYRIRKQLETGVFGGE